MGDDRNIRKQPLGVMAYEQICRKIVTLDYGPSQVLEEKRLMADLGLGRTPIREALLRLAGEGWVTTQPNRGAVVPPLTLQNTKAVFEAMKILEAGVADLAVCQCGVRYLEPMTAANARLQAALSRADILALVEANHTFHMNFAHCAQNEYLLRAMGEVRSQAKRLSYLSYAHEIEPERSLQLHYASVVQEHQQIITCLEAKDQLGLKGIVLQHITSFQQRIVRYLTS